MWLPLIGWRTRDAYGYRTPGGVSIGRGCRFGRCHEIATSRSPVALAHRARPLLACPQHADQTAGGRERTASRPSSSIGDALEERIEAGSSGRSIGAMSEGADRAPADDLESLHLTDEERVVLAKVGAILRRLSFGTVVLVVQDGKVVQIEMAEKFRLR